MNEYASLVLAVSVAGGDNHEVSGGHCSLIVNAQVYHRLALILARQRSASRLPE